MLVRSVRHRAPGVELRVEERLDRCARWIAGSPDDFTTCGGPATRWCLEQKIPSDVHLVALCDRHREDESPFVHEITLDEAVVYAIMER